MMRLPIARTATPAATIIGCVTHDVLVVARRARPRASIAAQTGGIIHSLRAFASHDIPTLPITVADAQTLAVLRAVPGVHDDGIVYADAPLPQCALFWAPGAAEPIEHTTTTGAPIPREHILAVLGRARPRAIYVNFTVGHDVGFETLKEIATRGIHIYMDAHMLLYARDTLGARTLAPPDSLHDWLACADAVQCNGDEYAALCRSLGVDPEPFAKSCARLLRTRNHGMRPLAMLVRTSARRIDWAVFRPGGAVSANSMRFDPVPVPSQRLTVGCGDAFGAGVFSELWRTWSPVAFNRGIRRGAAWVRELLVRRARLERKSATDRSQREVGL